MSTIARCTTLQDLPPEVLESVLVVQPPAELCLLACTNKTISNCINSRVWSAVARRHLKAQAKSVDEARDAADRLICTWWAAAGALVRDVPVHFRRSFVAVRARAGSLVRIRSSDDAAAFVMSDTLLYGPPPALEMDFVFGTEGPFPVDGMVARIVAAAVPREPARSPPNSPSRFSPRSINSMCCMNLGQDVVATARVLLNGIVLAEITLTDVCTFSTTDVTIPAALLHTKPRVNTLAVEYCTENSTAACWLKTVRLVPSVLPLSPVDNEPETVPLRHAGISSHRGIPHAMNAPNKFKHQPELGTSRSQMPKFVPHNQFAYSPTRRLNMGL